MNKSLNSITTILLSICFAVGIGFLSQLLAETQNITGGNVYKIYAVGDSRYASPPSIEVFNFDTSSGTLVFDKSLYSDPGIDYIVSIAATSDGRKLFSLVYKYDETKPDYLDGWLRIDDLDSTRSYSTGHRLIALDKFFSNVKISCDGSYVFLAGFQAAYHTPRPGDKSIYYEIYSVNSEQMISSDILCPDGGANDMHNVLAGRYRSKEDGIVRNAYYITVNSIGMNSVYVVEQGKTDTNYSVRKVEFKTVYGPTHIKWGFYQYMCQSSDGKYIYLTSIFHAPGEESIGVMNTDNSDTFEPSQYYFENCTDNSYYSACIGNHLYTAAAAYSLKEDGSVDTAPVRTSFPSTEASLYSFPDNNEYILSATTGSESVPYGNLFVYDVTTNSTIHESTKRVIFSGNNQSNSRLAVIKYSPSSQQ